MYRNSPRSRYLRCNRFTGVLAAALMLFPGSGGVLNAMPYGSVGDVVLRNQVELLQDEGLLDGVSMTWPYNLGDLYGNLQEGDYSSSGFCFVGDDLLDRLTKESYVGEGRLQAFLGVGTDSQPLRSFYSFSRDAVESGLQASVMGKHYAVNLRASYVGDPSDGDNVRLDGSYAGISFLGWTLAVDQIDRWWGPGWNGSLILSNNARPFPAVSLTRNSSAPFDLPVLSWLGNWSMTTFMGKLVDDSLQQPSNPYLWGLRVEIRPFSCLSVGFSRTAQWGGRGRPGGLDTFWDVLVGNDNIGQSSLSRSAEPGNQLAGFDWRYKPIKCLPVATYGQLVGEDAGGMWPTKLMFLGGLETWGIFAPIRDCTWRTYVEYADTAARYNLTSSPDEIYSAAYNHHIYKEGYRYKGVSLGHSIDGDGDILSVGLMLFEARRYWGLTVSHAHLDRHDDPSYANVHSVSRSHATISTIGLNGGFDFSRFAIQWMLSYVDYGSSLRLIGISDHFQASTSVVFTF